MSHLPRTTERPVLGYLEGCCEIPRRATPQSHGRKSVVRGLRNFSGLFFLIFLVGGCVSLEMSREVQSGRNALRLGKAKEAITHFEAAARMDPNYVAGFTPLDIGIWTYLGRAYYKSGNNEKALTSLKRAKASTADDYFARIYYGLVVSQLGNRREGIADLKSGLKGLAVWLETLPNKVMEGQYWDPGHYLADRISQTRKILQAEEPNLREITANVEWLGQEFEEEIQSVKEDEETDQDVTED